MKIAVASSEDGKNTEHFGRAQKFMIYEFDEENIEFLEERESLKVPGEKHQWDKSLKVVEDCDTVIATQMGINAKYGLEKAGIKIIEDEGLVGDVLGRFVNHYKFMKKPLF